MSLRRNYEAYFPITNELRFTKSVSRPNPTFISVMGG